MPRRLIIDRDTTVAILKDHKAYLLWSWMQLRAVGTAETVNIGGSQEKVKPGQLVMTLRDTSSSLGLTVEEIRRALSWLLRNGHIDNITKPRYHLITLEKHISDSGVAKPTPQKEYNSAQSVLDARSGEMVYIPDWAKPYLATYRNSMGGEPLRIKDFISTLRGLHKMHGVEEVCHRLETYLHSADAKFLSMAQFGATFKGWGKKVPKKEKTWWKKTLHGVELYYHKDVPHAIPGRKAFIERFPELRDEV